jgi:hypothetical protein
MPPGALELPGKDLVVDGYLVFENIPNNRNWLLQSLRQRV